MARSPFVRLDHGRRPRGDLLTLCCTSRCGRKRLGEVQVYTNRGKKMTVFIRDPCWGMTIVFVLTMDCESTDRCVLYACYGNPLKRSGQTDAAVAPAERA